MYYPLEFAENASYELFYEIYKQFYNNEPKEDLKDAEENFKLIDCMYSEADKDYYSTESFLKNSESVKLHEYGKAFVKYADILFDKEESPLRDFMELFMMNTIVNEWKKSKQVYTIDDNFATALTVTDNIKVPRNLIYRLPYRTFCIDLIENRFLEDCDAIFIHVREDSFGNLSIIAERTVEKVFFTLCLLFDSQDVNTTNGYQYYEYKKAEIPESPENLPLARSCSDACDKKVFDNGKHKEFCLFVLQFLLYLVASNSDITENAVTKQTYRPSRTIKNKFSEIRKWDVGYRIGKSIRLSCVEVPERDNEDEIENTVGRHRSSGYKLRPHYRRAHWQHYHVGPNRERIELRWKEPLFVNGSEKDIPAVVHKVLPPAKSE